MQKRFRRITALALTAVLGLTGCGAGAEKPGEEEAVSQLPKEVSVEEIKVGSVNSG